MTSRDDESRSQHPNQQPIGGGADLEALRFAVLAEKVNELIPGPREVMRVLDIAVPLARRAKMDPECDQAVEAVVWQAIRRA